MVRSSLKNDTTDLADFFFCDCNCKNKVCMKENYCKIQLKCRKFVDYKKEVRFLYLRAYLKKYSTNFTTVFTNGFDKSRGRF